MNNPYPEWGSLNEPEWAFRAVAMIDRLAGQLADLQEAVRLERAAQNAWQQKKQSESSDWPDAFTDYHNAVMRVNNLIGDE